MASANVHDLSLAEALIQGDEQGYFADKAYSSQAFRETLERRGLVDGVAWRARPITRSKPGNGSPIPGRRASAAASSAPMRR
jgi:IS5 family transposase